MRLAALLLLVPHLPAADMRLTDPADPVFRIAGAARQELVEDGDGRRLRLSRFIDMPGKGYGWDNPGATVSVRSDGRRLALRLRWSEGHVSASARNGVALILVDGAWRPAWTLSAGGASVRRAVAVVDHPLPVPDGPGPHTYTLVMPYGDSVEFAGLLSDPGAVVEAPPAAAPRPRWVAYGDSVTQGFDASQVGATYPWLVAQRRGWEVVNLGFGGRRTTPADAAAIAACAPALVSIAIGVNDWQGGVPPPTYRAHLEALLRGVRGALPQARIAVISPLWVAEDWRPPAAVAPLADYRAAAAAAAAAAGVALIDGATLIDHRRALFHRAAVHPLDGGFAQMAERLADRLFPPETP